MLSRWQIDKFPPWLCVTEMQTRWTAWLTAISADRKQCDSQQIGFNSGNVFRRAVLHVCCSKQAALLCTDDRALSGCVCVLACMRVCAHPCCSTLNLVRCFCFVPLQKRNNPQSDNSFMSFWFCYHSSMILLSLHCDCVSKELWF